MDDDQMIWLWIGCKQVSDKTDPVAVAVAVAVVVVVVVGWLVVVPARAAAVLIRVVVDESFG